MSSKGRTGLFSSTRVATPPQCPVIRPFSRQLTIDWNLMRNQVAILDLLHGSRIVAASQPMGQNPLLTRPFRIVDLHLQAMGFSRTTTRSPFNKPPDVPSDLGSSQTLSTEF